MPSPLLSSFDAELFGGKNVRKAADWELEEKDRVPVAFSRTSRYNYVKCSNPPYSGGMDEPKFGGAL